jgi:predicted nuclease of predicted toxin-antitoxin system
MVSPSEALENGAGLSSYGEKTCVFLDECLGREELGHLFGSKAHVYTARDLGVTGKEDVRVIDSAVAKKCLIVTVNKDFVEYYRKHQRRREGFLSTG